MFKGHLLQGITFVLTTLILFTFAFSVLVPVYAGHEPGHSGGGPGTPTPTGGGSGVPGPTGGGVGTAAPECEGGAEVCLQNPLDSSISSIPAFFLAILDILLVFAVPFVVFFIIYAGFMYVTARGNPGKIQQAHMALLYALIGGVLIFGARAILNIIANTVGSVT